MSAEKESTPILSAWGKFLGKTVFAFLSAASLFAAPQNQPALQISSPANGSTINPGQTLSVSVTSPAGLAFQMVAIIGPDPIGFNTSGTSMPAQFSIAIPSDADCHVYTLTADGLTQSGQSVSSAPIQIDVERPDFPLSLSTSDSSLNLESQGEQTHLIVLAGFLDGSQIDVTHSTLVSYVSSNAAIATVDSSGTVTAMAAGSASIAVIYTLGSQNLQIPVPVTVQHPMLSTSPSSLTFTAQSIGTSSPPQQLTFTNAATSSISATNVTTSGDFSETDNCISLSPLPVSTGCTVNVTFTPTTTGSRTGTVAVANSGNTAPVLVSLMGTGTAAPPPPTISNLSPTSGPIGTSVTITGTNFGASQGSGTVTFSGTAASPASWSSTSIVTAVPSGATTGNVVVTVAGQASNGVSFTATPNIASLSPTSGPVGAPVTITGSSFGATQGSSTVTFNGTAGSPTSWSATSIVVPVPSGATTGNTVVTVAGQPSNGVSFTVITGPPPPTITGLSPASGAAGISVTITGANFGAGQGTSIVTFNGAVGNPTSWSATSIVVPVPSAATTGNVVVTVGGVASNGVLFTASGTPPISFVQGNCYDPYSISPSTCSGGLGGGQVISKTSVIVPYTAAQSGGDLNVVVVGWYDVTAHVSSVTDSNGNAYALAVGPTQRSGLPGTLAIYYAKNIVSASPYNVVSVAFTSAPSTPEVQIAEYSGLDRVNPLDVAAANQGSNATASCGPITTTNAKDLLVASNLVSIAEYGSGDSTTAGSGYTSRVSTVGFTNILEDRVVTATGTYSATATMPISFDFIMQMVAFRAATTGSGALPSIASLSPTSGMVGTSVTIRGTNFGASQGTSTVTFGGTTATPTSWGSTSIIVPVPSGAGTGNVVVTVGGQASVSARFIGVAPPPTITGLSPASGAAGISVTITGANFGAGQGTSIVTFNGAVGNPTSWSATSIVVPVPSAATTGNVVVTVGGVASNGVLFTASGTPPISFVQGNCYDPYSISPSTCSGGLGGGQVISKTSVIVPYTAAQSGGDLNVVVVGWYDVTAHVSSVTDSNGNAYALAVGPTQRSGLPGTLAIYYAKNIVSASPYNVVSVAFTSAPSTPEVQIAEYSGLDRVNPLDVAAANQGSNATASCGPITTTNAKDLLVASNLVSIAEYGSGDSTTAGSGYTSRVSTVGFTNILEDRVVTATGTYSATATMPISFDFIMQMVAFRAAH